MKFPKTIKNFVQGVKPPFPRYGSVSGDCLRQVSPVVSIRNLSIRRTKLPSKAFICLRISYSALFSRHSAKALPSRLPASLTSFRLLPSVPTSISNEPVFAFILYTKSQKFSGLVIPGYSVSAVCCSLNAKRRLYRHSGKSLTPSTSQPAIIIICAAF